jgi:hypothetical protein
MASRAAVQSLLQDDPILIGLGVGAVYGANAVDTPAEDLFLIVSWNVKDLAFKSTATTRLTVWAHDKDRDYGRIADVLRRVRDVLLDAVHVAGADGWTLTLVEWDGEGPDLFDEGYNTVTRYSDFVVASRYSI